MGFFVVDFLFFYFFGEGDLLFCLLCFVGFFCCSCCFLFCVCVVFILVCSGGFCGGFCMWVVFVCCCVGFCLFFVVLLFIIINYT